MGDKINSYGVRYENLKEREHLEDLRRWDNIEMDLKILWEGVDNINLAQERDQWRDFVSKVMNLRGVNVLTIWASINLSRTQAHGVSFVFPY
jgi:hypothetical protein